MEILALLEAMVQRHASDLHLKAGMPPGLRVHGKLEPVEGAEALTPASCRELIEQLMSEEQKQVFHQSHDLDFSKGYDGLARFRVNLFYQRGSCGAVLRRIPIDIPHLEGMSFPDVVRQLCHKPRGLCLVTGPTGSGKSTTLAAMVDYINRNERGHILTLEDPIEFLHKDKKCFVNQREIGVDSKSFSAALRAALREDPNYILVGEMRDLETIGLAITAAETGHMVFGTLHTTSAIQTVDRIIDVFPHEAQQQVRMQLSVTLQGVISQTLLAKIGGGRACAQEIMTGTDAVRSLIREGKTPQLINVLQTSGSLGMQTLESSLVQLVQAGLVRPEDAIAKANSPLALQNLLEKTGKVPAAAPAPAAAAPRETKPAPAAAEAAKEPAKAGGASAWKSVGALSDFDQFRQRAKEKA